MEAWVYSLIFYCWFLDEGEWEKVWMYLLLMLWFLFFSSFLGVHGSYCKITSVPRPTKINNHHLTETWSQHRRFPISRLWRNTYLKIKQDWVRLVSRLLSQVSTSTSLAQKSPTLTRLIVNTSISHSILWEYNPEISPRNPHRYDTFTLLMELSLIINSSPSTHLHDEQHNKHHVKQHAATPQSSLPQHPSLRGYPGHHNSHRDYLHACLGYLRLAPAERREIGTGFWEEGDGLRVWDWSWVGAEIGEGWITRHGSVLEVWVRWLARSSYNEDAKSGRSFLILSAFQRLWYC